MKNVVFNDYFHLHQRSLRMVVMSIVWVTLLAACSSMNKQPESEVTSAVSNPWHKDTQTGCLVWRGDGNVSRITWDGACGDDGKAQGAGTVTYFDADGRVHAKSTCTFQRGKCEGQGVSIFANGDRYEGQFRGDNKHGRGTYTFANGDRYMGEIYDGQKHGKGIYTKANGDRYEGEFRDGNKNGQGVSTFTNGDRYEGQFLNGEKNGKGVYTYADGDRYEGQFRDGAAHGYGKSYYADGSLEFEGQWLNDEPVTQ